MNGFYCLLLCPNERLAAQITWGTAVKMIDWTWLTKMLSAELTFSGFAVKHLLLPGKLPGKQWPFRSKTEEFVVSYRQRRTLNLILSVSAAGSAQTTECVVISFVTEPIERAESRHWKQLRPIRLSAECMAVKYRSNWGDKTCPHWHLLQTSEETCEDQTSLSVCVRHLHPCHLSPSLTLHFLLFSAWFSGPTMPVALGLHWRCEVDPFLFLRVCFFKDARQLKDRWMPWLWGCWKRNVGLLSASFVISHHHFYFQMLCHHLAESVWNHSTQMSVASWRGVHQCFLKWQGEPL